MAYTLTDFSTFDTNKIRFGDVFEGTYKKIIPIGILDDSEEEVNQLILSTPANLLTFGVQEIKDKERAHTIGYQLPICLWGKKKVSYDEKLFTTKMDELLSYIKEFLYTIKDEISVSDDMINNIQILNYKYENGKKCEDKGPILYTKLLMSNKSQKILTTFIDDVTKDEVNPLDIINSKGTVKSAIKIENIIIGRKIIVQVKLFEVLYRKIQPYVEKQNVKRSLLDENIVLTKMYQKKSNNIVSNDVVESKVGLE